MPKHVDTPDSYASAMKELETITAQLQDPNCDIDTLGQLTKRALTLITFCKQRLLKTDEELTALLDNLSVNE